MKCDNCKYYNGADCTHADNKGFILRYRVEKPVYLKTTFELNKNGKCKKYVELSEK